MLRILLAERNAGDNAFGSQCLDDFGRRFRQLQRQLVEVRPIAEEGLDARDLQQALAGMDLRVRTYCPVGDLVAGMSYLVRRLLENTSNDSFLLSRSRGDDLDHLLAAP